jgi:hypothetical protein
MLHTVACTVLRQRKRLELRYDGFTRVVEVHVVGVTNDGNEVMRVWQVRGGSNSRQQTGFKLLRLDEAFTAHMIDEQSHAPRPGYVRGDVAMKTIYCEV